MDKATKDEFAKVHRSISTLSQTVGKMGKVMEKGFAAVMEDAAETRKEFTTRFISID